jgi:hypothetical protein
MCRKPVTCRKKQWKLPKKQLTKSAFRVLKAGGYTRLLYIPFTLYIKHQQFAGGRLYAGWLKHSTGKGCSWLCSRKSFAGKGMTFSAYYPKKFIETEG